MTKFDFYVERLEDKRRAEREEALNVELLRLLETRTKGETLADLYKSLIFIVGTADILTADHAKTLVF